VPELRPHRLTDAALGALGAGRPDAATVALLRRAVLSRRLLQLRAIRAAVPAGTPRWYADLAALDPPALREVLSRPLVGVRLADGLAAPQEAPRLLTGVAAPRSASARPLAAEDAGLALDVWLEDADPVRARLGLPPAGPLSDADTAAWRDGLAGAWRLLVERHRPAAAVLAGVLDCIVPVLPDPSARGVSASSAHAFGAVAMSAPEDPVTLAVGLLHEAQHSLLNAVGHLFELFAQPAPPGYSPWRDDPRPASGVLHGAYAYLAVARFWRAEPGELAAFEFARWRAAVASAAGALLGSGGLTPAGTRFVAALRAEVLPWLAEPVPARVARLAAAANADHRLRWRLRNLAPDPAGVRALAEAWSRGLAPPAAGSRLRPAAGRALERSARLDLAHAALSGRPGRAATAGDAAWLAGDDGTALAAYRDRVAAAGDDGAWAGLALVRGLARPELLRALHAEVGGDPLALADWLSGPAAPAGAAGGGEPFGR
jgi:hypothetical protein